MPRLKPSWCDARPRYEYCSMGQLSQVWSLNSCKLFWRAQRFLSERSYKTLVMEGVACSKPSKCPFKCVCNLLSIYEENRILLGHILYTPVIIQVIGWNDDGICKTFGLWAFRQHSLNFELQMLRLPQYHMEEMVLQTCERRDKKTSGAAFMLAAVKDFGTVALLVCAEYKEESI
ncbi:hypothetical protein EMCRGX_G026893 [Ephydatia muelleri]